MTRIILAALVALVVSGVGTAFADTIYVVCPVKTENSHMGFADLMYKYDDPIFGNPSVTLISEGKSYRKIIEVHDEVIHMWHTAKQKLNNPETFGWINLVTGEVGNGDKNFEFVHSSKCEIREPE